MKMKSAVGMLAALTLFSAGAGAAADGTPVVWEEFENWEVYLSTTSGGAFDMCLASRTYRNGEILVFYADEETPALGLFVEDWKLDSRDAYSVHLQFDEGPLIATVAVADESRDSVLFDIDVNTHIESLISAKIMRLHTGAGALTYDLTGAEAAIKSAVVCTINNAPPGSLPDQR